MIKKMLFVLALILYVNISWSQEITINTEKVNIEEVVPFPVLEDVPIFPGCEEEARNKKLACFQEKLSEHISKNFNYPTEARKKKIQGRVSVLFIINSDGNIEITSTKTPEGCELLEAEAIRIISLLPKMKPGKFRGEAVSTKYLQPIIFNLK
ncbi:energy transducer TonB [Flavobacterium proteolyticum]|uniref:Energy transducer TonB n=1 Tax=Flavobacterium proteolyticum TaxID=2911683 RepID=A0ABR9WQK6_9FLAO|nr:energy transducer TonB [Flavobacterium proteolyticum]MBE9576090.1 energy transducer TonB [Flavobacterium proteolyticum]